MLDTNPQKGLRPSSKTLSRLPQFFSVSRYSKWKPDLKIIFKDNFLVFICATSYISNSSELKFEIKVLILHSYYTELLFALPKRRHAPQVPQLVQNRIEPFLASRSLFCSAKHVNYHNLNVRTKTLKSNQKLEWRKDERKEECREARDEEWNIDDCRL